MRSRRGDDWICNLPCNGKIIIRIYRHWDQCDRRLQISSNRRWREGGEGKGLSRTESISVILASENSVV